jgi:hypothetical protein
MHFYTSFSCPIDPYILPCLILVKKKKCILSYCKAKESRNINRRGWQYRAHCISNCLRYINIPQHFSFNNWPIFHYDHVMFHYDHVMSHDNHVMSHDNHVMSHDAIIESRKILKSSKVKELKKKKRRRCHLIKGELLKTQFRTYLAKTRKKKKQKSQRRASVS